MRGLAQSEAGDDFQVEGDAGWPVRKRRAELSQSSRLAARKRPTAGVVMAWRLSR